MNNRVNFLLITVDDLNWNSVGCYGCGTPEITPHIDRLASEGIRFENAHVTIGVCQPSRGALATGCYPHRSGVEGFNHINGSDVPLLTEKLQESGYFNGILGKVGHSSPKDEFKWDYSYDMAELAQGRDAKLYYHYTKRFIDKAMHENKPFFLMANSHDPHRPFHGNDESLRKRGISYPDPSRVYKPEEVEIPRFLPDIPDVRKEIAEYSSSVRRCDDSIGGIMKALRESGMEDSTFVVFLSDNGMAFPFSKTNCYLHSTKTPLIVKWPSKVDPGQVDNDSFISGIDLMPTYLEAAGIDVPGSLDGKSFIPVLKGQEQTGRDRVFTQFHETAARKRYPMRCLQNKQYGYIFNAWSNGERVFKNESQMGRTFKAMQEAAEKDSKIADRVKLFKYRVVEEFYDFGNDQDALHNLIDDPVYEPEIEKFRKELEEWMVENDDPARNAFRYKDSPENLEAFMKEQALRSEEIHKS